MRPIYADTVFPADARRAERVLPPDIPAPAWIAPDETDSDLRSFVLGFLAGGVVATVCAIGMAFWP